MTNLRLGISTCPNDTFAFHGLLTGAVEIPGVELSIELLDIEALNEGLFAGRFDVCKASAHAALVAQGKRWMEAAGLALPDGDVEVGPLFALDQEAFAANLTRADFGPVFDRS